MIPDRQKQSAGWQSEHFDDDELIWAIALMKRGYFLLHTATYEYQTLAPYSTELDVKQFQTTRYSGSALVIGLITRKPKTKQPASVVADESETFQDLMSQPQVFAVPPKQISRLAMLQTYGTAMVYGASFFTYWTWVWSINCITTPNIVSYKVPRTILFERSVNRYSINKSNRFFRHIVKYITMMYKGYGRWIPSFY